MISDAAVWQDVELIEGFLVNVYLEMPILINETPYTRHQQLVDGEMWNGPFNINELSDESKRNWIYGQSNRAKSNGISIGGGIMEWWEGGYRVNRMLNEFIEKVPNSPIDAALKAKRVAEARFLRAYNYFSLVKRYGGVPLVTKMQFPDDPKEELFPPREKEQVIYDFILSELDAIAANLPNKGGAGYEYGRPNRQTVLALQSRAALYAASIAQYGEVELNGLVGIDKAPSYYYELSFSASEKLINEGYTSLYDKNEDKVENFKNIFLVKDNEEVLWARRHDGVNREEGGNGWVYDFFQCPKPHAWDAGNQNAPYLETVEAFEQQDGSSGALDRSALANKNWTMEELWGKKEPRFFATIYTQETPWKGILVDFHNGIVLSDGNIQVDGSYDGILARGTQQTDGSHGTGFGVMKYLDEGHDNMGLKGTSETDWQLFRFGEILLNHAEAAFELGKQAEALAAINKIRARAGVALRTEIDREKIRHERKIELAFEGHRYWDLRRWRVADQVLTVNRSGLRYILDATTGTYQLEIITRIDGTNDPVFFPYNIYLPINRGRVSANPNLKENPGYL